MTPGSVNIKSQNWKGSLTETEPSCPKAKECFLVSFFEKLTSVLSGLLKINTELSSLGPLMCFNLTKQEYTLKINN